MRKQYKNVIRTFFSDYFNWLLIVTFLFVFSVVAIIAVGNANNFIWIVPLLFIIIYCFTFRWLILYFKTRKDLQYNNIDKLIVKILKIEQDNKLGFMNQGGATVGKRKYRIIDENGNNYLLFTKNEKDMFLIFQPDLSISVEVEVLNKSRLVLSMKLMEEPKTKKLSQKQDYNIAQFKKVFIHYF